MDKKVVRNFLVITLATSVIAGIIYVGYDFYKKRKLKKEAEIASTETENIEVENIENIETNGNTDISE